MLNKTPIQIPDCIYDDPNQDGSYFQYWEAPEKEGFRFLYWKGSKYYPGDKYTVTGNHTLTAQ